MISYTTPENGMDFIDTGNITFPIPPQYHIVNISRYCIESYFIEDLIVELNLSREMCANLSNLQCNCMFEKLNGI